MEKIYRKQRVEGVNIPGIIHNSNYFYTDIAVYEDGGFDCWGLHDKEGFQEKIKSGWVVPQIPTGKAISIHGLGEYTVTEAKWNFTKEEYTQYILEKSAEICPMEQNQFLSNHLGLNAKRRVSYMGKGQSFQVTKEDFYQTQEGDRYHIFKAETTGAELVTLTVYKNGNISCFGEKETQFTIDEMDKLFSNKKFLTSFAKPTWVTIPVLGKVLLENKWDWQTDIKDKRTELKDMHKTLNKEKTAFDLCIQYYHQYLEWPSEYLRGKIKEYYEQIPEHERMYLGDMDTRDSDYQRIIYHPEQKREV